MIDFFDSNECFPGVDISRGVCYFLWEKEYNGEAEVTNVKNGEKSVMTRPLLENDSESFIRFNKAISILHKAQKLEEKSFATIVSGNDPFGFDVRVENSYKRIQPDFKREPFEDSVQFYFNGWQKEGVGFIAKSSNKFSAASLTLRTPRFAVGVLTPPLTKGNHVPSGLPYFLFGDPAAS